MKSNNRQKQALGDSSSGASSVIQTQKTSKNEKKLDAVLLTETAQALKLHCELLEEELREVKKQCNKLSRLLEHAVWEEDMIEEEIILFDGTMADFVELIGPLLLSKRWKVNGRHEMKPFLRALDSVFHVQHHPDKERLALGTLVNVVQDYLDTHSDYREQP